MLRRFCVGRSQLVGQPNTRFVRTKSRAQAAFGAKLVVTPPPHRPTRKGALRKVSLSHSLRQTFTQPRRRDSPLNSEHPCLESEEVQYV